MKIEYKNAYLICWLSGILFIINFLVWSKSGSDFTGFLSLGLLIICIAEGIIGWFLQNDYNEKRDLDEIDRIFDEITKGIQEDEDISV